MKKIAVTGPECSGKTSLSKKLAQTLDAALVEEYAREYLEGKQSYTFEDLDEIAKGQLDLEQKARSLGKKIIICDTDILVIKIWSQVKFGKVSPLVQQAYEVTQYDLTFLCKPIYEWEFDPLREAPDPAVRFHLYQLYKEALIQEGRAFVYLSDSGLASQ